LRRTVRLSPAARADIERLIEFLLDRDPRAPAKARGVLERALTSLADFSERGNRVDRQAGIRKLKVKFGRYGYAIHYRVDADSVFVTHVFHVREAR
jgi:plasmid stabilization system protein ParE